MIKIGAVWRKEKEGKVFYSGKVDMPCSIILDGETSILIFQNKSDHEQSPDFDVLISKPKQKSEGGGNGKPVEL
jgi:hypothetical protein